MQYSLSGLDQNVPGAKTMFTKSKGDFLDRGRIKETEKMMLTANEERETDIPEAAQISTRMRRSRMEADKGKRLSVKNMDKRVESKVTGEEELKNTQ